MSFIFILFLHFCKIKIENNFFNNINEFHFFFFLYIFVKLKSKRIFTILNARENKERGKKYFFNLPTNIKLHYNKSSLFVEFLNFKPLISV